MKGSNKLEEKQRTLIERTAAVYRLQSDHARQLLAVRPAQSVRLNRLKTARNLRDYFSVLAKEGLDLEPLPWFDDGAVIRGGRDLISRHRLVAGGELFIQNASSFLPVLALDPQPGDAILDMCAAPGGKASMIASLTRNRADLWVNDNSKPRLNRMLANFRNMSVQPRQVTFYAIENLNRAFEKSHPGQLFNKILLDAPCSGEGLININAPADLQYWSVAHIKRLQQLQKKAVMAAWRLLAPGGTLVYSTCTIAPEENESVVAYLLKREPDAQLLPLEPSWEQYMQTSPGIGEWQGKQYDNSLKMAVRVLPTDTMEAFFVAKITKSP